MDDILARLKPAANAPASDPLRFALYNLVLSDGQLDFADLPAGRTHVVRDLRPYLAYWPESLPFRLDSAVLHADIKLAFEQTLGTVVRLSGTAMAEQVRLLENPGRSPGVARVGPAGGRPRRRPAAGAQGQTVRGDPERARAQHEPRLGRAPEPAAARR